MQVFSGSIGGTSDFVFRGLSLTRGKPAAQASIDVEFPREFYVGAFVATADPNPGPSPTVEMDVWAGRYWRLSENFSGDLRLSQYTYPDDPRRVSYNRTEITGTLGFRNQLFFAAIYSPNTKAVGSSPGYEEGNAWAVELSGRHRINERFVDLGGLRPLRPRRDLPRQLQLLERHADGDAQALRAAARLPRRGRQRRRALRRRIRSATASR